MTTPTTPAPLSQEEKRVKIAEALGARIKSKKFAYGTGIGYQWQWRDGTPCAHPGGGFYGWGWNQEASTSELPSYFSDLNAIHAAEKAGLVTERQIETYLEALTDGCGGDTPIGVASFTAYFASAAQRAEAFGKTLGLW